MAAEPPQGQVFEADDAGVIADHAPPPARALFVSLTQEDRHNAVSMDIAPMACLNLGDVLFEFDSSIVLEAAGRILAQLPGLRRSKPNRQGELPLVSIFGHADPSGDDEYNKTLSGRRAKAVYGLLTHDPAIWNALYTQPFGGDDWSKKLDTRARAQALGLPPSTPRDQLFLAIMQATCPEPLSKADFLGRGADPGGKADFQGCGEFNPLLLLSADELKSLPRKERNALNVVDRRVTVFLFRPEIRLDVGNWPCPRAGEASAGCRKRFFSDASARLKPGPERKRHRGPDDETFGCRFYDRIAGASPCERILLTYRVRLFDGSSTPLPRAPFTLTDGKRTVQGLADENAFVTVRDIKVPADVKVEWSRASDASRAFEMVVHVDIDDEDAEAAALRRLHNLGYEGRATREDDVRAFQRDHAGRFPGLQANGRLDDATRKALEAVNDACEPSKRQPEAAPSGPARNQGDPMPSPPAASDG